VPYNINRGGINKDNYIGKGIIDLYSYYYYYYSSS